MSRKIDPARLSRLALVIGETVDELDAERMSRGRRAEFLAEINSILTQLAGQSEQLTHALERLHDRIAEAGEPRRARSTDQKLFGALAQHLKRIGLFLATQASHLVTPRQARLSVSFLALATALAAPAAMAASVGDAVTNPNTGATEHVVEVISPVLVRTDANHTILLAQTLNQTFTDSKTGKSYQVIDRTLSSGRVVSVKLKDLSGGPDQVVNTLQDVGAQIAGVPVNSPGGNGSGFTTFTFPTAAGDVHQVSDVRRGANGGDGSAGGGVEICVFGGCFTIGVAATAGGDGVNGPSFSRTITAANNGDVTTVSDGTPGVAIISAGGNGGRGGDAYLAVPAAKGGSAGVGGNVDVTSSVTITTTGTGSHGLFVQSVSGVGGNGGTGYVFSGGGASGGAGQGGTVTVNNSGNISTAGDAADGIVGQSLGGNAGTSGSSYGVVGKPGDGSVGGNGGDVTVTNNAVIRTRGVLSIGIFAESVGGEGGAVGNAGGIVALGGTGGRGGNGGNVTVNANAGTDIATIGAKAYGILAQSTGGGGGVGGGSGGLVALGSSGATAGSGGVVTVNMADGARIVTGGIEAHGIFAESVGGGGGVGGGSGGLVTVGGKGGAGGNGGSASVIVGGSVETTGVDARGVFVQSVGGGGGSVEGSGALVTIGGSGSGGGDGGSASATVASGGSIVTTNAGATGLYVQSIGGGGGSGSSVGGVVAVGGTGGNGGAGGTVTVSNAGSIATGASKARGIFAQSVGGGGGDGGDGGGLVVIGGNGSAASIGGAVTVTDSGLVSTSGNRSAALYAQSIGGGGGSGGTTGGVLLTVGGKGASGGSAGVVTVNLSGALMTGGFGSDALFAQSVGGGGGDGGSAASLSAFAGVAIGGSGAAAGDGGTVDVNLSAQSVMVGGVPTLLDPFISTAGLLSRGIVAQSVGGGGGNGGFAVQATGGFVGAASIAIGGSGGGGGAGGTVTLDGDSIVLTTGPFSDGVLAQSVGGGGGTGGFSISVAGAGGPAGAALSIGIGGSGGAGGNGGLVSVHAGGSIQTGSFFSTGFTAQSVGGGGGDGGFDISAAGAGGASVGATLSIGVGGSGDHGGDGGTVDATYNGTISTSGFGSLGALIQSVGGAGGRGGFNISGSAAAGASGGFGAAVGLGGTGKGGGNGGTVTGSIGGNVQTFGFQSTGVLIQSAGGGGGSGGFNISGAVGASGTYGGGLAFGLGGSGAGGGIGGTVIGDAHGTIYTEGWQSDALVVQSIGGGGGTGGFNVTGAIGGGGTFGGGFAVGLGGAAGSGGDAGSVTGRAWEAIWTRGDQSRGAVFQSNGGSGGVGGFNVSGSISGGGNYAFGVAVGVGGAGGDGGKGGTVIAQSTSILTEGFQSAGFLAQSAGGGGGAGGFNVSGAIDIGGKAGAGVTVGVGGAGGGGGSGGTVTATVDGDVTTKGDQADAITAQSLGGSGGTGAFNVSGGISVAGDIAGAINVGIGGSGGGGGDASTVDLTVTGTTLTGGEKSTGILAQSTGGSGGAGSFNVTGGVAISKADAGTIGVGVGGQGGDGGDGGKVTLKVNRGVADAGNTLLSVGTQGKDARGIVAQSVGGGGGSGGFNITGGLSLARTSSGNIGVGVGGGGGQGGDAGEVHASINGDVATMSDGAEGVFVQSLGGGGGNGGFNVTGGVSLSREFSGNLLVGVGGFGDHGGNASLAEATLTSDIATLGNDAGGLTVQSLGGSGGNGAFNITGGVSLSATTSGASGTIGVGVGGFGKAGGAGGDASATLTGDVSTQGTGSHGILVESIGGGGGNGGFNVTGAVSLGTGSNGTLAVGLGGFGLGGGKAGNVTGTLTGDVTTKGSVSFGAMLQSAGGAGGNGALNISGALTLSASNSAAVSGSIGIGGFGGTGGNAGTVTGTVTGIYSTAGRDSDGVVAESLAGGGGHGGINISGALGLSLGTAGTASIGIGGFGGGGGDGGEVTLTRIGDTFASGISSDGVIAQSVGGAGGKGGINISGGISASLKGSAGSFGFGLGGFGGVGGAGGDVTLAVRGNVAATGASPLVRTPAHVEVTDTTNISVPLSRTIDNGSNGVIAQSVGGGGGAGALNVTGGISLSAPGSSSSSRTASIGIGGFGGTGGDAGKVDLTIAPPAATPIQISSYGDGASAVIAQSLGGSGGAGGINISGGISMDGQLTVGIGGFGGAGGLGRDVTASVDADLFATGTRSRGMLAQSVGGGGGNGAINISGGIQADTTATEPSIVFGVGGFGGAGNRSGDVVATQLGQVLVDGKDSIGVLVQSVAGGGGDGGLDVAASFTVAAGTSKLKGVAFAGGLGGNAGAGADAGSATLTSNGNILINTRINVAANGTVTLTPTDYLTGATGILVQSVGGGGGVGGMNVTGAIAPQGNPIGIGIGGSGGAGGDAGDVTVTRGYTMVGGVETETPSLIRTFGDTSDGLIAQSIGGGGGKAGINGVLTVTAAAPNDPISANLAIGGSGGDAGNGGTVTVRHRGDIATSGANSDGIFAQSISKGGGLGNFNVGLGLARNASSIIGQIGGSGGDGGDGGEVTINHKGVVTTEGNGSIGIEGQSVGGGGGKASTDFGAAPLAKNELAFTLGAHGGTGGTGGTVTITAAGAIDTKGEDATAIFAQSVGGGGGQSGSRAVSATATTGTGTNAQSYNVATSVGLDGGVSATGGAVTVTNTAQITTAKDRSLGIWAQSIGGSGGAGGSATGVIVNAVAATTISVGGTGGAGSKGGTVDVTNGALISTKGNDADGVFAQSVGGGGGQGGFAASAQLQLGASPSPPKSFQLAIGGSGGVGGIGDTVHVTNTGSIFTIGANSIGVHAESIGGGGGYGGMVVDARFQAKSGTDSFNINVGGAGGSAESGGSVTVTNEGLIWTQGVNAAGISASSIGGGGGDAGLMLQIAAGVSTGANQTHNATINVGGAGGNGGKGGDVTVTNRKTAAVNSGIILTEGINAYGILAQSIGGGGGNSSTILGFSGLAAAKDSGTFGLSVGAAGGAGNDGGTVHVINDGAIQTNAEGSHGILAQSIGGGGGNGGLSLNGSLLVGSLTSTPLISIGGTGGAGGNGGPVTVDNHGSILTQGKDAHGIVAQSIAGGGGNAGVGLAASPFQFFAVSNALSSLIGATGGGTGGSGGVVIVNNTGDITVLGQGSQAIKAESINGGGGTLAFDVSGIVGLPGVPVLGPTGQPVRPDPLIVARLGGKTLTNQDAKKVTVNQDGTLGAGGNNSVALAIQSVGGGGGTAIYSLGIKKLSDPTITDPQAPLHVEVDLGGQTGSGNTGGDLDGAVHGQIVTNGTGSPGTLIQTIGGGGGRAIIDITAEQLAFFGGASLSFGSDGVSSSAGGTINRTQTGAITTTGDFAPGAIVQSIGGGGGTAMVSVATGVVTPVAVSQTPDSGTESAEIVSQMPDASAPAATADEPSTAVSQPAQLPLGTASAAPAQAPVSDLEGSASAQAPAPVGQPGHIALAGSSGPVAEGGHPGLGQGATAVDDPAQVTLGDPVDEPATNAPATDPVVTGLVAASTPADSPAQASTADLATAERTTGQAATDHQTVQALFADATSQALATPQAVPPPTPVTIAFGANGGAGLNGGAVGFGFAGGFTTLGAYAPALIVQSIGAGGGLTQLSGSYTPTITLGGTGGASGDGGDVAITNSGTIHTEGSHSHGVFLQSIGGGGGAAFGAFTAPTLTLNTANSGNGGHVSFTQTGDIVTLGDNSDGVVAQSLGGGGGWIEGVFAGTAGGNGAGGAIDLSLSGATFTQGLNSTAVLAQSLGANGGGNIQLTSNGMIRGGTGTGAGVRFAGGATDRITTSGSISAISGLAIDTGDGNDTVQNNGLIVGNVDLGAGVNAVQNSAAGTFIAFNRIDLRDGAGSSGVFTNSGSFLMGLAAPRFPIDLAAGETFGNMDSNGAPATNLLYGSRVINTVDLDGNFVQTASGFSAFDVAFGPYASDRVNVSGNTTVAGNGEVILTWLENKNPVTLFATAGTAINNGLNIRDTLAIDFNVLANSAGIQLTFNSNFGQPFLNRNERALGGHMDSAVTQGASAGIGRLLALLGNLRPGEEAQYKAIFDQLNPEPFLIASVDQFNAARAFSTELFGCATPNGAAGTGCVWTQAGMDLHSRTGDFEYAKVGGELTGRFRTGFERPIGGDWMLGGALGYDTLGTLHIDHDRATSSGDGVHAGLGARYAPGTGPQLAVSLTGGWQWNHTARGMNIFGPRIGTADQSSSYAQASAEAAYVLGGRLFARPSVRGTMTALRQNGFSENGLAGLGIESLQHTQWIATVNPELALGVQLTGNSASGTVFSVSGGATFNSTGRITAPFRLLGANPSADPAMIGTLIDQSAWHAGAHLRVVGTDQLSLRLNYDRDFGKRTTDQRASLDLRLKF